MILTVSVEFTPKFKHMAFMYQHHMYSAENNSQSTKFWKFPAYFELWSDTMTKHLASTSWVMFFFKVSSVNKLCPVQFVKCPTKVKSWKDICPANNENVQNYWNQTHLDWVISVPSLYHLITGSGWAYTSQLKFPLEDIGISFSESGGFGVHNGPTS